jgi:hypothetical protein
MGVILLRSDHRHFGHSCGLQDGKEQQYKHIYNVTVKNRIVLAKIPVKWQNSDD